MMQGPTREAEQACVEAREARVHAAAIVPLAERMSAVVRVELRDSGFVDRLAELVALSFSNGHAEVA